MPLGVAAAWKLQALLNLDHTSATAPAIDVRKEEIIGSQTSLGSVPVTMMTPPPASTPTATTRSTYVEGLRSKDPMRIPASTP